MPAPRDTDTGGPRRRRRRPRRPSATERARAQERSYGSQGQAVERAADRAGPKAGPPTPPPAPPRRAGPVVFRGPFRQRQPDAFRPQVDRARQRARSQGRELPDSAAIPHVPLLRDYTPRQRETVREIYHEAAERADVRNVRELYKLGSHRQRQQMRRVSVRIMGGEAALRDIRAGNARDRVSAKPEGSTLPRKVLQAGLLFGTGLHNPKLLNALGQTTWNVGRATAEDPQRVAKSSVRTAVESVAGIPAGLKAIAEDPVKAIEAIVEDYEDRYGDVLSDPKAFRERVKNDWGLTPYALDAAAAAGGTGMAAGALARSTGFAKAARALELADSAPPGARALGRAGTATHRAVTEPRPLLREFAGEAGAREQPVSSNLFVAGGQRGLDRARRGRFERRVQRAGLEDAGEGRLRPRADARQVMRLPGLRPGQGEVLPLGGLRETPMLRRLTGRVARDIGGAKSTQRVRLLEHRARSLHAIDKLSDQLDPNEQRALKYLVQFGLPADRSVAVPTLERRLEQIREARERDDFEPPAVLRDDADDAAAIEQILAAPEKHLTPNVREVADALVALQRREEAGDPDLTDRRALLRRLTPQGELLGVPRRVDREPPPAVANLERLAGMLEDTAATQRETGHYRFGLASEVHVQRAATALRGQIERLQRGESLETTARGRRLAKADKDFDQRVQQAAEEAGLQEPGYWMSSPRPRQEFSLAAVGTGGRAVARSKRYEGRLFELGIEETGPDVLRRGVERNIKRRFSWALVGRNMDVHAFEWSRGQNGEGLSAGELLRAFDERAIDPATVALIAPRIARRRGLDEEGVERGRVLDDADEGLDDQALAEVHNDLSEATIRPSDMRQIEDLAAADVQGQAANRYLVVAREVADELEHATRPDSGFMRSLQIVLNQKPARILLGTFNAPWLMFQVASNTFLTGIGGGRNPLDIYGAHKLWRGLTPEQKDAWEAELGITHGHHWGIDQTRLGSTKDNMGSARHLVNFWQAYKATRVGRLAHKANPLDFMFRVDERQNNFFRKVLFYNQAKKAAYRRMGSSWRSIDGLQGKLSEVLALPPEHMAAEIARHAPEFEQHAKHVRTFLGDYLRYSDRERRLLGRNVMFYGYLRFSLRFAFYTMPVQHPIMSAILADIGRMGAQEMKDLFGVPENYRLPTNMLAGQAGRMNPFLNAVTQLESAQQLAGLVSPIYQALADQAFSESSFTGRDYRILGQPTPAAPDRPKDYYGSHWGALIPGRPRNRILLRDMLGLAYPYRVAEKTGIPEVRLPLLGKLPGTGIGPLEGPQGDDSLLWDPRPTEYRDEETVRSIRRDVRRQRDEGGQLLRELVPILKPPASPAQRAAIERELEKEGAGRGGRSGRRRRRRRSSYARSYGGSSSGSRYGGSRKSAARYGG